MSLIDKSMLCCCRSVSGPGGKPLHESELHAELDRKAKALTAIDASIEAARAQLANPKKAGEREVWETNVVILQVYIHRAEISFARMETSLAFCRVCCMRYLVLPYYLSTE